MKTNVAYKIGAVVIASALVGALGTMTYNHSDVSKEQALAMVEQAKADSFKAGVTSVPAVDTKSIADKAFASGVASVVPAVKTEVQYVNVTVDNGKLAQLEQTIYDNNGKVEFLTQDLKDTEIAKIADRVVIVNDFKDLAVQEVKDKLKDLVNKEGVNGTTLHRADVMRVRVNSDATDIVVDSMDFDNKDATLLLTGTFEQDSVKYKYEVSVDIKDGAVEDSNLDSLELN